MAGRGFTLIELLVVMGLMALLTAAVFGNSFGMSQASAYATAQDTVYNVLQMARQRACIDGKDVYVFVPERKNARDLQRLAVIEGYGLISVGFQNANRPNPPEDDKSKGYFVDNGYSMQQPEDGKTDIYNLTSGGHATLAAVLDEPIADDVPEMIVSGGARMRQDPAVCKRFEHPVRQIWLAPAPGADSVAGDDWQTGQRYGFSVLPDQRLPKGFEISVGSGKNTICFYADGTSGAIDFDQPTRNHDAAQLEISETVERKAGGDKTIKIEVLNGNVQVKSSVRSGNQ